jgi:hypothetical protein
MNTRNQEIMRLAEIGETYGQIAFALGLSRNVVAGVVYRNRKDKADVSQAGHRAKCAIGGQVFPTLKSAAKAHCVSEVTMRNWINRGYRRSQWLNA